MIYVDIRGGYGNQLFQYALARSIQEATGQAIQLNHYNLDNSNNGREFVLDRLVLNSDVCFSVERLPFFANIDSAPLRIMHHFFPGFLFRILCRFGVYVWFDSRYFSLDYDKKNDYYLAGWWQCHKYFSDIDEILRREIIPKDLNCLKDNPVIDLIESEESVCVQIRRGDYIENEDVRKSHYLCNESYFSRALLQIDNEIVNPVIFCFSDDIDWVKQNIKYDGKIYFETGDYSPEVSLYIMSKCKNFVISNSSFGWWAQFLSDNPNKVVYAPSKWLREDVKKRDIYMDYWRLIHV